MIQVYDREFEVSDDQVAWAAEREFHKCDVVARQCENLRTVIQAGANCGVFPYALKQAGFGMVVTLEPVPDLMETTKRNLRGVPGIVKMGVALGAEQGTVDLSRNSTDNSGTWSVFGPGHGSVQARVVTIDSLGLGDVDLIYLDVEGSEMLALAGGVQTIARCRPVLAIENNGLCPGFESGLEGSQKLRDTICETYGYMHIGRLGRDDLFVPRAGG